MSHKLQANLCQNPETRTLLTSSNQRNLGLVEEGSVFDLIKQDRRVSLSYKSSQTMHVHDTEKSVTKLSIRDDLESLTDLDTSSCSSVSNNSCQDFFTQLLAIIVGTLLVIVMGIPFGAAYFPIIWSNTDDGDSSTAFPVAAKEAFGLRLFLFSTMMCQLVLTFTSTFTNPVGLQIVENVPFFHAIAFICFQELGYGIEALSNLLLMLALTTILVGLSFYILGALELGRVIYFIPKHVLVGLIGGIGVFVVYVSIQVSINQDFALSMSGFRALFSNFHLFAPVLFFELLLRVFIYLSIDKKTGKPSFALLAPTYYCLIPPLFFLGLWSYGISFEKAQDAGYFFPSVGEVRDDNGQSHSVWAFVIDSFTDPHLFDIWLVLDFRHFSLSVLIKSIPTIVGMALFSLIHVPIYVPAFSMTTGQDVDINEELIAHGWSNIITGLMGGLQNYMAYSNSVAYAHAGGRGRSSSLCLVFCTMILFVIGPAICVYIPRCMAGVILLHLGIDLIREALVDAFKDFDSLEYIGIWFITVVIAIFGMEKGLLAGLITALSVYIVQSVHVQHPINDHSSAALLRSSKWNRSADAKAILDDEQVGSSRICIIQLQGHLFFGNLTKLNDSLRQVITQHEMRHGKAWILILDFSLVLGIDASAAMGFTKIKEILHSEYDIALCIYVTGEKSGKGFPCEYRLADDLVSGTIYGSLDTTSHSLDQSEVHMMDASISILLNEKKSIPADHICNNLDEALKFAEDALISRIDKSFCYDLFSHIHFPVETVNHPDTLKEEVIILQKLLTSLLPEKFKDYQIPLISNLEREVLHQNDVVWENNSFGTSAKFVVRGMLVATQDQEKNVFEEIESGQIVGEAALVQNIKRTSTVKVKSKVSVLYSLSKESYDRLLEKAPKIAMCMQMITIHNLAYRSRRVTDSVPCGRSLPI